MSGRYGGFLASLDAGDIGNLFNAPNKFIGFMFKQYIRILGYPDVGGAIRFPMVIKRLNPRKSERILDIGCGRGFYSHAIAESGADVFGVDDGPFVEIAQRIGDKLQRKAMIFRGDITKLQLGEDRYDKIISIEVLEHVIDDEKVFSGWCRLLKPGGRMIFSVPLATDEENAKFVPDIVNDPYGHKRAGYSLEGIKKLTGINNMRIIEYESYCGRIAFNIRESLAQRYKSGQFVMIMLLFPLWLSKWRSEITSTTETEGYHSIIMTLERSV